MRRHDRLGCSLSPFHLRLRDDSSGVLCFILSTMRTVEHAACIYCDVPRAREMKSLGSTWVDRRRPIVILSATGIASADASGFEKTFHPPALHSRESCWRCARRRVSSRLLAAARRRIRARKRIPICAVERVKPRYRQTKTGSTAARPAGRADGPKAQERRAERMRRMQGSSGRP
jgi:hypothetical protein